MTPADHYTRIDALLTRLEDKTGELNDAVYGYTGSGDVPWNVQCDMYGTASEAEDVCDLVDKLRAEVEAAFPDEVKP